jgi:hypothetical protein
MLFSLTLALTVFRVLANHPDHAAPMNDLALHADFLDRCPDFHFFDSVPRGNIRGAIPFPKNFTDSCRGQGPGAARNPWTYL